jgi:hypothetical protein
LKVLALRLRRGLLGLRGSHLFAAVHLAIAVFIGAAAIFHRVAFVRAALRLLMITVLSMARRGPVAHLMLRVSRMVHLSGSRLSSSGYGERKRDCANE